MTEPAGNPVPYRVSYSGSVRDELRKLVARALERGLGPQMLAAMKELDRRLRIYPQFGDPVRDSKLQLARVWIGVVPPLVAQYVLDDLTRRGGW
jgi:hypothetical protein